jgi:hypothetical protein
MDLPIEIYCEIFKSLPCQQRISKQLNQYNKNLFYDQFKDLPISKHEFITYFKKYKPDKFVIFKEVKNDLPELYMYLYQLVDNDYFLYTVNLYIDEPQTFTYQFTIFTDELCTFNVLKSFDDMSDDVYYDLFTSYYIIEARGNKYERNYINNLNDINIKDVTDITSYCNLCKSILYTNLNIMMLTEDDDFDIDTLDLERREFENIIFKNSDDINNIINKAYIEELLENYKKSNTLLGLNLKRLMY